MRVAFLSYDGLTDPLGQSQILPYMTGLALMGHNISIFSFEKAERYKNLREKIQNLCVECSIEWIPLTYHKDPPILSTIMDLFRLRLTLRKHHQKKPFDIIHCRSYPTSIIGQWMKTTFGTKFIFDMRGYWADERVEGGLWNLKNPVYYFIYKYFKRKEQDFLITADYVVSLTQSSRNEMYARNIRKGPIAVIPTCVDLDLFNPAKVKEEDRQSLKANLGIGDEFVMLYLGSWGTWYLGDQMMEFFGEFKKMKPDAKLLIVSTDRIRTEHLWFKSDIILTESTRERVPVFISIASASLFFIKPTFSKTGTYATKMGEIMAMNVPIITNPGWGDAERIVHEAGGYLNTDPRTMHMIVAEEKIQTREYCTQHLSLDSGISKYNEIYNSIKV